MVENLLDPVVLFFVMGIFAGILKTDLRLPETLYETLSIYLLITIGLKGGVELTQVSLGSIVPPVIGTLLLGISIPLIAYPILRYIGKMKREDSAALAAHYGSTSAVTFAVVMTFLTRLEVFFEEYTTVLLVLLEIPAIAVGIMIARLKLRKGPVDWGSLTHEIFLGKSIYLLLGGMLIGYISGPVRIEPVSPLFFGLFKGALAFFLLEMGILASRRLRDLKKTGFFLLGFGIIMPLISCILGIFVGYGSGLSVGGTTVLATLCASASYIAAPAAVRIAIPQANPTFYLTAALGITFPFNIVFGIPLYYEMSKFLYQLLS